MKRRKFLGSSILGSMAAVIPFLRAADNPDPADPSAALLAAFGAQVIENIPADGFFMFHDEIVRSGDIVKKVLVNKLAGSSLVIDPGIIEIQKCHPGPDSFKFKHLHVAFGIGRNDRKDESIEVQTDGCIYIDCLRHLNSRTAKEIGDAISKFIDGREWLIARLPCIPSSMFQTANVHLCDKSVRVCFSRYPEHRKDGSPEYNRIVTVDLIMAFCG